MDLEHPGYDVLRKSLQCMSGMRLHANTNCSTLPIWYAVWHIASTFPHTWPASLHAYWLFKLQDLDTHWFIYCVMKTSNRWNKIALLPHILFHLNILKMLFVEKNWTRPAVASKFIIMEAHHYVSLVATQSSFQIEPSDQTITTRG